MKCPRCGKTIPQGCQFCPYCGTPLAAARLRPVIQREVPSRRRPRRGFRWILVPVLALAVALGVTLLAWPLVWPQAQPAPAARSRPTPTLSSPADGAQAVPITPTLAWEPLAGVEAYHLQVAKDSNFSERVCDWPNLPHTSVAVGALDGGTQYWWRVGVNGEAGPVWSPAWSFVTAAVPPAAPVLYSPADQATGVDVTPALAWKASAGAVAYNVEVAGDPDFTALVYQKADLPTTTDVVMGGLARGTRYWWRVAAENEAGVGPWSAAWSFTTQAAGPLAPLLSSPANGARGVPVAPTLSWKVSGGASSYLVQISRNVQFTQIASGYRLSGARNTSVTVGPLAAGTQYWWRVKAGSAAGDSPWSAVWTFTTGTVPAAPNLISPAYGALRVSVSPTLRWSSSLGAASYRVQVSPNPSFKTLAFDRAGITGTAIAVTGLSPNTEYWWRVSASNAVGTSAWSLPAWNFTTGP
ncbi:MAG: zinc-ribbon domain-containing protein [Acetobacteraceae bacterium]|nr:zinc-ribbon domain-containing protein [Acetobacteraceae bacterium]